VVLSEAEAFVRQHGFVYRMPAVVSLQVLTLLRQGHLAAASQLAQTHDLPLSQARVHLAQGDPASALAVLGPLRQRAEARSWQDNRLNAMVLQALAHQAQGDPDAAMHVLGDALALAEPGGFIRLFVDEGEPMAQLLDAAEASGLMPDYVGKLLAVFQVEKQRQQDLSYSPAGQDLAEPLSQREMEVLHLIAQGLSNGEISAKLFLALDTVKGHNRKIFSKLQVQRRTEAIARARELNLL
jgi:LuxR family maltose regulon positive regulatory protein